jgi:hypothetical protein
MIEKLNSFGPFAEMIDFRAIFQFAWKPNGPVHCAIWYAPDHSTGRYRIC